MSRERVNLIGLNILLALAITFMGCSKDGSPPPPLAIEQMPLAFEKAFKKAKPDVRDLANQIVLSVQSNALANAYAQLQTFSAVADLTKEQSSLVGRAMLAINAELQSATTKGDQNAAATLDYQRKTK